MNANIIDCEMSPRTKKLPKKPSIGIFELQKYGHILNYNVIDYNIGRQFLCATIY